MKDDLVEDIQKEIAALEGKVQAENARIAEAVSARQIGDGYWHEKRRLDERLRTARAVLAALAHTTGQG